MVVVMLCVCPLPCIIDWPPIPLSNFCILSMSPIHSCTSRCTLFPIHLKNKKTITKLYSDFKKHQKNVHFDCEIHLKLLKLHRNMGHALACLYLYLWRYLSSYQKCKKMHALSHDSRFKQPNFLLKAHLSHCKIYNCVLV